MSRQVITVDLSTDDGKRLVRHVVVDDGQLPSDMDTYMQDMVDTLLDEGEEF